MCVCVCNVGAGQLGTDDAAGDFLSLRPRLHSVLIGALHTETDTTNTQMILGQFGKVQPSNHSSNALWD